MMTAISAVLLIVSAIQAPDDTTARVAELIEQLDDKRAGHHAAQSLREVGPEAVPQLIHARRNGGANRRESTNMLFLAMGCKAVPPLIRTLRDQDPAIRKEAAVTLGYLATHAQLARFISGIAHNQTDAPALSKCLKQRAVPALTQALDDDDLRVRAAALDALAGVGPDVLDPPQRLLQFLKDERTQFGPEVIFAIGQLGAAAKPEVERLLEDKNELVRGRASAALKSIRIAELVRELQDKEARNEAAKALIQLGPDAVYPILRQLEKEWVPFEGVEHGPVTSWVADAVFLNLGADAVPPLVETLQDGNPLLQILAAYSLGRLAMVAKGTQHILRNAEENDAVPRVVQGFELSEVIVALKEALADTAVPALQIALKDEHQGVREFAAMALGSIGEAAKDALPDLLEMLKDKDDKAAGLRAASAIARIGPEEAVPALIEALNHEDAVVRRRAASALGRMGHGRSAGRIPGSREAVEAIPVLIEALKDDDDSVVGSAASALGSMGVDAKEAVPALIEVLTEGSGEDARFFVVRALGELGQAGKEAVPVLTELLDDDHPLVRRAAEEALAKMGVDTDDAIGKLLLILSDADEHLQTRAKAARALGQSGPAAKEAIPALIDILDHEQHWVIRGPAARALGMFGPEAKEAVPALIRAVNDEHPWADPAAAAAAVGMPAPVPAHQLVVLRNKQDGVRSTAAWSLGQIGRAAKAALPALENALLDENERIRSTAEEALKKIDPSWKPE